MWGGTVVCCGPESSGTRLLSKIVSENLGLVSYHQSMPHAGRWWTAQDFPGARFVVIVRRPDFTQRSAVIRGLVRDQDEAREHWEEAMIRLASIPNAYWISYEALVAHPSMQIDNLARWLGVKANGYPEVYDGNSKWEAK
jgi:hypothetical protein